MHEGAVMESWKTFQHSGGGGGGRSFVLILAQLLPLNTGGKRGDINDFEQRQIRILFEEHLTSSYSLSPSSICTIPDLQSSIYAIFPLEFLLKVRAQTAA